MALEYYYIFFGYLLASYISMFLSMCSSSSSFGFLDSLVSNQFGIFSNKVRNRNQAEMYSWMKIQSKAKVGIWFQFLQISIVLFLPGEIMTSHKIQLVPNRVVLPTLITHHSVLYILLNVYVFCMHQTYLFRFRKPHIFSKSSLLLFFCHVWAVLFCFFIKFNPEFEKICFTAYPQMSM